MKIDIRKEIDEITKNSIDSYKTTQCITYVECYFLQKISEALNTCEYIPEDTLFSNEPELLEQVQNLLSSKVDNTFDRILSKIDVNLFKAGGKTMSIDEDVNFSFGNTHGYLDIDYLITEYRKAMVDTLLERVSTIISHCKTKPVFTVIFNAGYKAKIISVYAND